MIRLVIAAVLVLSATCVQSAADITEQRPNTIRTPTHWDHPDHLGEGFVADFVATRDTDHFERNIVRLGAMVRYESIYDFVAIGASRNEFRQGSWSHHVNSLVGAIRKVDRATAEGITARLAVAVSGDTPKLHGEGTWNIRFTERTGIELVGNRDAVESRQAIEHGIMSNFVGVSLDHALTDRVTVIGMPTYRSLSDGNDQKGVRAWLIYALLPEQGLSAQLKYRGYESSKRSSTYFSPDRYERAEIGLRLRRAFGDWRVFATADYGKERVDGTTLDNAAYQVALTAQRNFANNASVGLQLVYFRASDSENNVNSAERYAWRMARLYFTIPF